MSCSGVFTNKRKRVAVISRQPSVLAKNFLKATCGSVSGYEPDRTSDTHGVARFTTSSTDIAEEGEDSIFFESLSPTKCSPEPSHPFSSVAVHYSKGIMTCKAVNGTPSTEGKSPQNSNGVSLLPRASSLPSLCSSNSTDQSGTKSPTMQSQENTKIIGHHSNYPGILDKHRQRSHSCSNLNSTHWTSTAGLSPVHRPTERVPSPETKLRRVNAIKRRPLFDLGTTHSTTDVSLVLFYYTDCNNYNTIFFPQMSLNPTVIHCHLNDLNVEASQIYSFRTNELSYSSTHRVIVLVDSQVMAH